MMKLFKKLKKNTGETLVEVLVSLLIISFSVLALSVCVNGASNNIKSAKEKLDKYYLNNNVLSTGIENEDINNIPGYIKVDKRLSKNVGTSIQVYFYENDAFKDSSVIAYVKKD